MDQYLLLKKTWCEQAFSSQLSLTALFDPVTLTSTYELDLYILKMYLHAYRKFLGQGF